jgi:hypothetical protein
MVVVSIKSMVDTNKTKKNIRYKLTAENAFGKKKNKH